MDKIHAEFVALLQEILQSRQTISATRTRLTMKHPIGKNRIDQLKDQSRHILLEYVANNKMSLHDFAEKIGIDRSNASCIVTGKLKRFGLEKLLSFIDKLDIEIHVLIERTYD